MLDAIVKSKIHFSVESPKAKMKTGKKKVKRIEIESDMKSTPYQRATFRSYFLLVRMTIKDWVWKRRVEGGGGRKLTLIRITELFSSSFSFAGLVLSCRYL